MLRKPETDDRLKPRLFMLIKDITESIVGLLLRCSTFNEAIDFMEDKAAEIIEQMKIVNRKQWQQQQQFQQEQQQDADDQALF